MAEPVSDSERMTGQEREASHSDPGGLRGVGERAPARRAYPLVADLHLATLDAGETGGPASSGLGMRGVPPIRQAITLATTLWVAVVNGDTRSAALRRRWYSEVAPYVPEMDVAALAVIELADASYRWLACDDQSAGVALAMARRQFLASECIADAFVATVYCAMEASIRGDVLTTEQMVSSCAVLAGRLGGDGWLCWAEWTACLANRWTDRDNTARRLIGLGQRFRDHGDWRGAGWALELLTWVTAAQRRWRLAVQLMGAADAHWGRHGLRLGGLRPINGLERRRWERQAQLVLPFTDYAELYGYGGGLDLPAALKLAATAD